MSEPYREAPPQEEGGDVVAIASYSTAVEAEMAQEYLKSHAITAAVAESARFNPLVNMAAGGVRLLVHTSEEGRARALLRRVEKAETDDDDKSNDEVRCPKCELTYCFHETALSSPGLQASAFSPLLMVLLLPLGLTRKRWRCHKCLHVWDDPEEGPRERTPLHEDDPKAVFRLKRHRAGTGLFLGLIGALFAGAVISSARLNPVFGVVALLFPIVGYIIGRRVVTSLCSEPSCRAELSPAAKECPSCRGAIAGTIRFAHEHFSEAAAVRRELHELRLEEEKRAKKKRSKKAPRSPGHAGSPR